MYDFTFKNKSEGLFHNIFIFFPYTDMIILTKQRYLF